MSRATMKTKYRIVRGFTKERDATTFLSEIQKKHPSRTFNMKTRKWDNDKRRFYVREMMRKGRKTNA